MFLQTDNCYANLIKIEESDAQLKFVFAGGIMLVMEVPIAHEDKIIKSIVGSS